MESKNCPKCNRNISATYEPAEPDVGILMGGWVCEECKIVIADDGHDTIEAIEL